MRHETYRYFIRLNPVADGALPRARALELQRQQADEFIANLQQWLADQELTPQVSSLSATTFGQIQIICTRDVMYKLRASDWAEIVGIQQPVWEALSSAGKLLTNGIAPEIRR